MTATAMADNKVTQVIEAGATSSGTWIVPVLLTSAVLAVLITGLMAFREFQHRRRRDELEKRLSDLEGILIGLSIEAVDPTTRTADDEAERSSPTGKFSAPRGPLSTAISILRHDAGPGLPGPDRVDLRATLFVYEQLNRGMTPADLAAGLNISLRTLQRGLSTSLGCTPRELILAVKMREAKRMLLEEDSRVQEAARAVGFDDPFHFSRRFKTYYRVSPTEMQNRISRSVA